MIISAPEMRLLTTLLAVLMAGGRAFAFDCSGVTFPSSIVICGDPELMRLADERQQAFNDARWGLAPEEDKRLLADQNAWVRSYSTACGVPPDRPPPIPVPPAVRECFANAGKARIAYLRAYRHPVAQTSPPGQVSGGATAPLDHIGPSFDCSATKHPLALMLCADPQLSLTDFRFGQAYYALLQSLDSRNQAQLKEEDEEFIEDVQDNCGIPHEGGLSAQTWRGRECVKAAYEAQTAAWIGRLGGAAYQEATRSPERQVTLQRYLLQLGFLASIPVPGVYTQSTRAAITAWQSARGRLVTGLLGDADALALEREVVPPLPPPQVSAAVPPASQASAEPPKPQAPAPSHETDGTGFAIDRKGNFLTNYHVIKNCDTIRLRWDGIGHSATVVASDERNDLAVVRTTPSASDPLRFREGTGIRPGDGIVVLGFPYSGLLSSNPQVTTGGVSALSGIGDDIRFLQLTAPVQPGNSGGPLLDLSSNVVGIVSSRINDIAVAEATGSLPQNINFAIKSAIIRTFLDAHQVSYETAQSTTKMEAADVAEAAAKSTFLVVCLK